MAFTSPQVEDRVGVTLQEMSLCELQMVSSSPLASVRCSAFTVIEPAAKICSLITSVATPGTETVWFAAPVTTTATPANTRPLIVLDPLTPWQDTLVFDCTFVHESAAAAFAYADSLAIAETLVASPPLPCEPQDVGPDENTASVMLASDAEMEPPADARTPVSA